MHSLTNLNTFGVPSNTVNLHRVENLSALEHLDYSPDSWFILGGGSNVLFIDQAPDNILLVENQGIEFSSHGEDVLVTVQAGVVWHELVKKTLAEGFSGLENLALIPGKTGAAPIQNIGAYGVELCDRFVSLKAWDFKQNKLVEFSLEDCQFGYRDSVFKSTENKHFLIWEVTLRLDKVFKPVLAYHGIMDLEQRGDLSAKAVFDEVVRIRQTKLPDPAVTGNAGSFFKNPVVDKDRYGELIRKFPNLVAYPQKGACWKLAAAWLIDQAGLKGFRKGDAGIHDKQALVLVNHGDATGHDLLQLAKHVQNTVNDKFGVMLEPEVNIVGSQGRLSLDEVL
jgi:UDP-N-acetylmuramate dehydrogenase